jgi:hypothetical protein
MARPPFFHFSVIRPLLGLQLDGKGGWGSLCVVTIILQHIYYFSINQPQL